MKWGARAAGVECRRNVGPCSDREHVRTRGLPSGKEAHSHVVVVTAAEEIRSFLCQQQGTICAVVCMGGGCMFVHRECVY